MYIYMYTFSLISDYIYLLPLSLEVPVITEGHVRRKVLSTLWEKIRLQPNNKVIYRRFPRDNIIKTGYKTVEQNSLWYFVLLSLTSRFSLQRITILLCQSSVMVGSIYLSKQMFLLRKRNKKSENIRLWGTHLSLVMMTTSTKIFNWRLMI
jgi:hypothetical protein